MSRRPFGTDEEGKVDEEAVKSLDAAISMVEKGEMSLREASEWLECDCGKRMSHMGLKKRVDKKKLQEEADG